MGRKRGKSLLDRAIVLFSNGISKTVVITIHQDTLSGQMLPVLTEPLCDITAGCLVGTGMDPQHPLVTIDLRTRE